jgi:hypothetical protein
MTILRKILSLEKDSKAEVYGAIPSIHRSLWEYGFHIPFQEHRLPWLLERWDHPDGSYILVAYKSGGVHISQDINDPEWMGILNIAYLNGVAPVVFTSENWFRLRISYPAGNVGDYALLLSPKQVPQTRDDWYRFTDNYVPPVPIPVFKGTRIILENGRTGKTMFIRTYRKAPGPWSSFVSEFEPPWQTRIVSTDNEL